MAYSPDGGTLASIGFDGRIRLWDSQNGMLIANLAKLESRGWALAFSADGRLAAGFADGSILVMDAKPGSDVTKLEGTSSSTVRALAFLSGNRIVAAGGNSGGGGRIRCWDIERRSYTNVAQSHGRFDDIQVSPDGTMFAACDRDGNVVLHDAETLEQKWSIKAAGGYAASIHFSHDSQRLICAALNLVSILRASDGFELGRLRTTESVREVLLMPNDSAIVTAALDGTVRYCPAHPLED